jgi:hypothetical protein
MKVSTFNIDSTVEEGKWAVSILRRLSMDEIQH